MSVPAETLFWQLQNLGYAPRRRSSRAPGHTLKFDVGLARGPEVAAESYRRRRPTPTRATKQQRSSCRSASRRRWHHSVGRAGRQGRVALGDEIGERLGARMVACARPTCANGEPTGRHRTRRHEGAADGRAFPVRRPESLRGVTRRTARSPAVRVCKSLHTMRLDVSRPGEPRTFGGGHIAGRKTHAGRHSRHRPDGRRWSPSVGQLGGLGKLGPGFR